MWEDEADSATECVHYSYVNVARLRQPKTKLPLLTIEITALSFKAEQKRTMTYPHLPSLDKNLLVRKIFLS